MFERKDFQRTNMLFQIICAFVEKSIGFSNDGC